ncbi:NAD(P)H-dependent flavin oxidoreductase [Aeromicrobium camelliae]|nr:nitronate monooxygenase [Aeromicrobium camelliae]
MLDLDLPLIAAPMAGGPSTPELVAAVTRTGAGGFLAAGYLAPEAVAAQLRRTAELTHGRPFGVNLFVVEETPVDEAELQRFSAALEPYAREVGAELAEPTFDDDAFAAKLDIVLAERPAWVSFTFGCPDAEVFTALADRGIVSAQTVTDSDEARIAAERGADVLVVQGPEAGGHRGTLRADVWPTDTPLVELLQDIADIGVPMVAAGGIATRADVRRVLDHGARAAQIGTALLLADEAGTNPTHRAALRSEEFATTVVTRAFTGRPARGLANTVARLEAPAAYPHVHTMTSAFRKAAAAQGRADLTHLWAGLRYREAQPGPAAGIITALVP